MSLNGAKLYLKVQEQIDKPWFVVSLFGLAAADLFIYVVPTDGIAISTMLMRPKRWFAIAASLTAGNVAGAMAVAELVYLLDVPKLLEGPRVAMMRDWIDQWGVLGLGLIASSPLPQQPAVALASIGQMSLVTIFLAILTGRTIKYGVYAWVCVKAPHLLKRLRLAQSEREEIKAAQLLEERKPPQPPHP
jgi:membrane protein YqaA with SNARE-associated domain